jgi:phosphatidate phosphatase APP1
MSRPHVASVVEDRWNRALGGLLARAGWQPRVVGYAGYGGADFVRVLARVVLDRPAEPAAGGRPRGRLRGAGGNDLRRGWRSFLTAEVGGAAVTITVAGERFSVAADRSGIVDVRLPNPGLAPGWHTVGLDTAGAAPGSADVLVVAPDVDLGLVSDIDDTVITTWLPRPLLATYNTFVLAEDARTPVAGMAELYAGLLADHPGAPTVYVSTGPWNAAPALTRFLAHHGFPQGPLLLTDWGPTNTGWFRSGREHKRACLRGLVEDFPAIRWVLVGDDGQRDPVIYAEFAREHPDRVRAIALRELPMGQQVLAHGTPTELPAGAPPHGRPEVRGADGHELAERLRGLV